MDNDLEQAWIDFRQYLAEENWSSMQDLLNEVAEKWSDREFELMVNAIYNSSKSYEWKLWNKREDSRLNDIDAANGK